jgi:hypothetical protein
MNRDARISRYLASLSRKRRVDLAERGALIAQLGWAPEPVLTSPGEHYAATAGELFKWVAERFGLQAAESCRARAETDPLKPISDLHSDGEARKS